MPSPWYFLISIQNQLQHSYPLWSIFDTLDNEPMGKYRIRNVQLAASGRHRTFTLRRQS
jgi:hypothetical protein